MNPRFCSFLFTVVLILFVIGDSHATHNRAGEITYEQIDEVTIRATITTYTKTSSFAADRDSVEIFWGDGTSQFVTRANGTGEPIDNDIKINYYIAEHSYPSRGTYTMGMVDPNRVAGILNIDFPNSVNIRFYIETTFTLLNPQFQGENNSVVLLQPPIDVACVGEVFTHNPNAYDPDGDSISYELAVPFQDVGEEVPNYLFPDELSPGPDNVLTLDPVTGELRWESPQNQGEVNITIRINEYREGVLINSLVRDMQVTVSACQTNTNPPIIEAPEELCVIAGEKIMFNVISDDIDPESTVILSATGGPFELENSPASFNPPEIPLPPSITVPFEWQTNCNHVSDEYYQLVFRSVDNSEAQFGGFQGLATLKTVRIKVVAPPPQQVSAEVINSLVKITWQSPYECEVTEDEYFRGFSVWRKNNSTIVPFDTCTTGLDGQGYEKIIFLADEVEDGRYVAFDEDVERGQIYCYRILAEFAKRSLSGNPFNIVESIRSDEVCVELLQDRPLITKVSVESTDANNGTIKLEWVLPVAVDVDTVANPGPYRLTLKRSPGIGTNSFTEIASFSFARFGDPVDTTFTDVDLNTFSEGYTYEMEFYSSGLSEVFSRSPSASSIFLNTIASDRQIELRWVEEDPWSNFEYVIFRKEDSGEFDSIGSTSVRTYVDNTVQNGQEECYLVMSLGTYNVPRVPDILENFSQEACAVPIDTVPPCNAILRVSNLCDNMSGLNQQELINNLSWTVERNCDSEDEITVFRIYFSEFEDSALDFIAEVDGQDRVFSHQPNDGISGCYVVTTLDELGNESPVSNKVCLDNCPLYDLPNTFTPNDDQANDLFTPRINRFIERVELEIYNKWGQVVFKTEDPQINWDGRNEGGKELAQGAYYYKARVFERRLSGIFEQDDIRVGYINLIR